MVDFLLLTAFVCFAAFMQYRQTKKAVSINNNSIEATLSEKQNKTWLYVAMFVMAVLVALRAPSIGNDTEEYRNIFFNVINDENYISVARYEKGYLYLNMIVGKITDDPQVLFALLAVFQYSVFTWFIAKYSDDTAFALLLFYVIIFGSSMNIVRQITATAFILIGVDRVLQKHTIRAFIWLGIAVLFHTSAVIFLVVPIIPYVKFNNIAALLLTGIVIVFTVTDLMYVISSKLFPEYAHYFSGKYVDSGRLATFYQVMRNGAFLVIAYIGASSMRRKEGLVPYNNAKIGRDKQINMSLWCALVAFAGMIYGFKLNLVDRIISYVVSFYIVLLPGTMKGIDDKYRDKLKFLIVVVLLAYSVLVQAIRPEWNTIYPYQFFWQNQ